MKTFCTLLVIFLAVQFAQGQAPKTYIVNTNNPLSEQVSMEDQYLFPDFKQAHVSFTDFTSGDGMMNYNFLLDEFHFLDNNGKKLAIANPEKIASIVIDSMLFIYTSKGYFEVKEKGKVNLLLKRKSKALETGKKGAYDQMETTSKVYNVKSMPGANGRRLELGQSTEVQILKEDSYWFSDGKNMLPVNSKSIFKFFPASKSDINKFIKSSNTKFESLPDLLSLVKYCNSLP